MTCNLKAILAVVAGGWVLSGCSSDMVYSKAGESCGSSADCQSGLVCLRGVCAQSEGETSTGAVLGAKGESCTRRADCEAGLKCLAQVCTDGEETPENDSPLGVRGETCTANADCMAGLSCIPVSTGTGAEGLGRCDFSNYNLTATGKQCWAECKEAADCCELPVSAQQNELRSCSDLAKKLGDTPTSCETNAPAELSHVCFLYKTYCDCSSTTWSCTSGQCVYTKDCTANGEVIKGCPSQTRAGNPTPTTTCETKTNKCVPETVATGCTRDTDCDGRVVADDWNDTCSTGECVCIASSGGCYRKCNHELDCAQGYSCDSTRKVCVARGQCDTDAFCTKALGNVTAKCIDASCRIPCVYDQDCSSSGLGRGGFDGEICVSGVCVDIGCSSDAECQTEDGVKLFCAAPPASAAGETLRSAITD